MYSDDTPIENEEALRRIGALDPDNQEVLIRHHGLFGEPRLSYAEIAQRMNMSTGTVRVLERRALSSALLGKKGAVA